MAVPWTVACTLPQLVERERPVDAIVVEHALRVDLVSLGHPREIAKTIRERNFWDGTAHPMFRPCSTVTAPSGDTFSIFELADTEYYFPKPMIALARAAEHAGVLLVSRGLANGANTRAELVRDKVPDSFVVEDLAPAKKCRCFRATCPSCAPWLAICDAVRSKRRPGPSTIELDGAGTMAYGLDPKDFVVFWGLLRPLGLEPGLDATLVTTRGEHVVKVQELTKEGIVLHSDVPRRELLRVIVKRAVAPRV